MSYKKASQRWFVDKWEFVSRAHPPRCRWDAGSAHEQGRTYMCVQCWSSLSPSLSFMPEVEMSTVLNYRCVSHHHCLQRSCWSGWARRCSMPHGWGTPASPLRHRRSSDKILKKLWGFTQACLKEIPWDLLLGLVWRSFLRAVGSEIHSEQCMCVCVIELEAWDEHIWRLLASPCLQGRY